MHATPPGWALGPQPITDPAPRALLAAYVADLVARIPDFDLAGAAPPGPHDFDPPQGVFLVGSMDGEAVACGALKTLAPGVGELRRMFVVPAHRGRGLGRRVLEGLEEHARAAGLRDLRLDTSSQLAEAVGLYRSAGYEPLPAYNDNGFADVWLGRRLPP